METSNVYTAFVSGQGDLACIGSPSALSLIHLLAHTGTVFNGIFYSYGGHFVDDAGTVDLNNEGNVEALTWTKQLVDEKVIPGGLEIKDLRGLFASGQIGIIFDGDMGLSLIHISSPSLSPSSPCGRIRAATRAARAAP